MSAAQRAPLPNALLRLLRAAVLILLPLLGARGEAAGLTSGPMAGFSSRDSATIWLMTDADARVSLDFWPDNAPAKITSIRAVDTSAAGGRVAQIRIEGLAAGTRYRYRVRLDGRDALPDTSLSFVTQPAANATPRDFRLATGSCAYLADESERAGSESAAAFRIFDVIADKQPDLTLWLGDTIYFRDEDFDDSAATKMNARWASSRAYPPLQRLLRVGHHYGIWDDHDYGPNDSDKTFAHKSTSLDLLRRYWANGSYGLPDVPGIFSKVSYEDVDLFLLDDRTYRDDDGAPDTADKTMLGAAQIDWLKRELLRSRATFKLIANGSRMLSERPSPGKLGGEGWHNDPAERAAFLQWLAAERIDGVMLVSGDIHYTHLTERSRPGSYPLVELTCSPLTSRVHPRPNPIRPVDGTVLTERNFCTLDFSGKADARELRISAWRADGSRAWQRRYGAEALRNR